MEPYYLQALGKQRARDSASTGGEGGAKKKACSNTCQLRYQ
jgi:hypothetical protein